MAKLSSASIRLVQKMNRMNKNGEYPIYIVVCFKGRLEKATGVSCLPRHWDAKREVIKGSAPNAPVLNKIIQDIKNKAIERKNEFEYNQRAYTPSMLLEEVKIDFNGARNVFKVLMDSLINERRLKDGTIRSYTYTYRKLCEYLGRKDFIVDELTLGIVKDFAAWLERNNIKINTIKRILSCVAAVWNYAIGRKIVSGNDYPFIEFRYTTKYHEVSRDYFLERSHIVRLRDYWFDLVIERNGKRWRYKDGALDKLHNRCSAEFGILWFLMCYKMNGSSPIELAMLRLENCKSVVINGEDYWAIDIRRRKTSREVHIRLKRDLLTIIGLEHFLGFCGHFVYPILHWKEGCEDKFLNDQSHKVSQKAMEHVKAAFMRINEDIAKENAANGGTEPTVDLSRLVFYTERHSFAQHYLSSPKATVNGLASLMARSQNTIATYVKQITRDEEIAEMVEDMPI